MYHLGKAKSRVLSALYVIFRSDWNADEGHSKNKIPTSFSKNETVIASVTQWSEAICQVPADFFLCFPYEFKVYKQSKYKYSAGTWQIASLALLVRNDSFVFR